MILLIIISIVGIPILFHILRKQFRRYRRNQEFLHECEVEDFLDEFGRTTGITYKTKEEIQRDRDSFDSAMKIKYGFTVYK